MSSCNLIFCSYRSFLTRVEARLSSTELPASPVVICTAPISSNLPRAACDKWNSANVDYLCDLRAVRFIYFRTDFFKISDLSANPLSTNIRPHTEFRYFIFDSVRVITFLVKSVFSIRHGWRK
jgi:hypothetical protein